ncbi:Universal stress protein family protein [Luteibacter sp. UNCMF331Sha3.1]|uniref:universal stress protein n=1 Tax=Luteibacter sp. UNCMF331Sha3.1 TaxID=1502760 RepID=UPI0008D7677F|nr:universal stress protein [Luteibacter sp. UNCMF331Sha3.1]SEN19462.1 Universal stress protein family protein [Luteibacter sp. UNCMF331Sha3.1]
MVETAFHPRPLAPTPDTALTRVLLMALESPADMVASGFAGLVAREHHAALDIARVVPVPAPATDVWALAPDMTCIDAVADAHARGEAYCAALKVRLEKQGIAVTARIVEAMGIASAVAAAREARRADLVVMGRPSSASTDRRTAHTHFATTLIESGRPVVVVPSDFKLVAAPPRRVIVAWSHAPQAMRAVNDALPLLRRAERVDVLMVDPAPTALERAGEFGAAITAHLERHGVTCCIVVERSRGRPMGQTILERASRSHAQLIVAGGYGHSRVRRWALGGTTRTLYRHASVPVLFSH